MKRILLLPLVLAPALSACVLVADGDSGHRDHTAHTTHRDRAYLNAPGRSDDRPYSHAVRVGDTLWVAGTTGPGADGQIPEDPRDEIRNCLDGVRAKLELAGYSMNDLVSVQVFCSDVSLYETFNGIYRQYFDGDYPARAFITSGELLGGARFEVQGTAVRR